MSQKTSDLQSEKSLEIEQHCFHCGDKCEEVIKHDSKPFCCHGCVTVYDILNVHNLVTYYELNGTPGIKGNTSSNKFAYLENEEIVNGLLDFKNDDIEKITLKLPAIHCSSCIWLLENLTIFVPGVKQSRVNFIKKEAAILYNRSALSLFKLVDLLCSIGYEPDIKTTVDYKTNDQYGKSLVIKLAVAGFFFGNSMLISLPHYLDESFLDLDLFSQYFGLLNILFTLPVILYSASDYFKSAITGLKNKFLGIDVPISLGIITLFIRSSYEILFQTGAGYSDSLCGLVFFLLIGKWYQNKTYKALAFDRDYKSFFPIAVNKIDENYSKYIPIEELKVGDRLAIRNQEVIPADCIIIKGSSSIDYSFVTGESDPIKKAESDLIYAGGRHQGSLMQIEVIKEVSSSYLTSLWNQSNMKEDKQSLKTAIDRISSYFTVAILLIGFVTMGYWAFVDPSKIWNTVTSVLIVACPCALALAVPFTYGHVLRHFGKRGLYLKSASIIEQVAKLKLLVFDKTGTITTSQSKNLEWVGPELTEKSKELIKTACSNSMHPFSRMISTHFKETEILSTDSFCEEKGKGINAQVKGLSIYIGASSVAHDNNSKESIVAVEIEGESLGYFRIKASMKEGILTALQDLKSDYEMHLVSGDNDSTLEELRPYFHQLSFNQKPKDKLRHIELTKESNLAMIGDGLNDAGALRAANVGISVVEDLHQFSPACDAIIKGDQLKNLPGYLRFSKVSLKIVYFAFAISFLYNFVGMAFAVMGLLTPLVSAILMPISSVTVVGCVTLLVNYFAKKSL